MPLRTKLSASPIRKQVRRRMGWPTRRWRQSCINHSYSPPILVRFLDPQHTTVSRRHAAALAVALALRKAVGLVQVATDRDFGPFIHSPINARLHSLHVGVPLFGAVWVPSLPPLTQCEVLRLWGYGLLPGLVVPSHPPLTPSGVFWYGGACGELVYRMFHDRGGDFCSAPSPPFGGAPWRFAPKVLSCNRDIILEPECCWRIS